jgi:hypothetical protein
MLPFPHLSRSIRLDLFIHASHRHCYLIQIACNKAFTTLGTAPGEYACGQEGPLHTAVQRFSLLLLPLMPKRVFELIRPNHLFFLPLFVSIRIDSTSTADAPPSRLGDALSPSLTAQTLMLSNPRISLSSLPTGNV